MDRVRFRMYLGSVEECHTASAGLVSESSIVSTAGDAGPGVPTPWLSLRTILRTLCARAAIYPSQSTFHLLHSPRRRDLAPVHAIEGSEGTFRDGAAVYLLPVVGGSPVPFPGPQVQRVILGKADVPPFLSQREAIGLDRTGLTALLAGHIVVMLLFYD